jgi:putative two-component system response regulator
MTPPPDTTHSKVLVVDDEKSIRITAGEILRGAGYDVSVAENVSDALGKLSAEDFDVVLSDIVLPGASGVDLLKSIRDAAPDVQVIMMTGEPTVETAAQAVRAGASDYLAKPVSKTEILAAVGRAAQTKQIIDQNKQLLKDKKRYQETLEHMVQQRTVEFREALEGTIYAMARALEFRDPYTAGHQKRVAELSRAIAKELGLPEEDMQAIYFAGVIHDIGKLSIPAEILSKPSRLTDVEFELIKVHPSTGYEILKPVPFPWPIADAVLQHHERLDGSGYPNGLSGDAIKIEARVLAVADTVEAMASHRPYRPSLGIEPALAEITAKRGTFYDPDVVDACLRLFREKDYALE